MKSILKVIHKLSSKHRNIINIADLCGCFYCTNIFKSEEMTEWVDNGNLALCPKCGIDSVLPIINARVLQEMRTEYFDKEIEYKF